jgi:hypothetical protein
VLMQPTGIYQQDCRKKCSECGEIVGEVDAEFRITRGVRTVMGKMYIGSLT